jgi:anaerobic dimethyl sulfoxide reductase subunit C (anchor subunit)
MGGEWSLVAFTIIGQTAVGVYIFLGVPLFFSSEFGPAGAGGGVRLAFALAVIGLLAVATALAFFHLHHPVRAYRVLRNIGNSWLSREIFFEIAFMGLTGLMGFCEWRRFGGAVFLKTLYVFGGLAGVLFLLAMSRLYMLPAVPAWNHFYTPLSFCLTALVLGAVAAAAFFGLSGDASAGARLYMTLSLFGVAASLVNAFLLAPGHGPFGVKRVASLRPPEGWLSSLHAARLVLLLAGAALLASLLAAGSGPVRKSACAPVLLTAVVLLVSAGEISGRFHFYSLPGRRREMRNSS